MAKFDADELGKRLEELNREQLASLEKVTEGLLHDLQRKGPIRAGTGEYQISAGDRVARGQTPRRQPPGPPAQRTGGRQ
jgi:hypothetical protein